MVTLAVRLLEAELIVVNDRELGTLEKLSALLLKRRSNSEGEKLLIICSSPGALSRIFLIPNIRKQFSFIAAWVIDSFWVDNIPRIIQASKYFDHFFICSKEDIPQWEKMTKTSVSWLPRGTDALGLGGSNGDRKWDLRRVGRQPIEWSDDGVTEKSCTENNVKFQGRPEGFDDHIQNQKALMAIYQQSKLVLAFSNTVHLSSHTHPTRSYITERWIDALACGSVVAGIAPKEAAVDELLWEGATLELGTIKREEGLVIIKEALANWSPKQAKYNYKQSLQRLDWRWRFVEIAKIFQIQPQILSDEIKLLELKIDQ
jgi:hypothetical protein